MVNYLVTELELTLKCQICHGHNEKKQYIKMQHTLKLITKLPLENRKNITTLTDIQGFV